MSGCLIFIPTLWNLVLSRVRVISDMVLRSPLLSLAVACAVIWVISTKLVFAGGGEIETSPEATIVHHEESVFSADPEYAEKPYSAEAQKDIYGGKTAVKTPRPMFELGRKQYQTGPFDPGIDLIGSTLFFPSLTNMGNIKSLMLRLFSETNLLIHVELRTLRNLMFGNLPAIFMYICI